MASIKKVELQDGSTRWRIRVYAGRDPETGKRSYVTRTYDRKTDADREATRLERQKDMGAHVTPSKDPLASYLEHWLDNVKEGRVRARTLHDYRGIVRRYIKEPPEGAPPIGKIRMDRLAPAAFEELYSFLWRDQELAPRTIQYVHSIVRQALSHAVKTGALARNPTDAVKPPKQSHDGDMPEKAMRAMTREEADRFLEVAREDDYAALWLTLLMGGIRPGEAFGLRWEDVNLDEGRIHVRHSLTRRGVEGWKLLPPKTAKARRVVVLPDVAVKVLREHRAAQAKRRLKLGAEWEDHDFVFTSTFGAPLDLSNVYQRWIGLLETANLGTWEEPEDGGKPTFSHGFRLYDLRHTCATLLLLAGENPKVVSERLGHASVTLTLDTYSHVLPSMQEASAEKLEAMFGSG